MVRTRFAWVLAISLAGWSTAHGATLSVGSLAMPPNSITTMTVSGAIASESTYGVTVLVELVPRAGATGTVMFTAAPPTDIIQAGDPWPSAGTFSPFDTDTTGSNLLNGTVDDNGTFVPSAVTFSGPLSRFPVQSSASADGVWDVLLTTSVGSSGWEGLTTTLIAGTITVTASACIADVDCNDSNVCTTDLCNAGTCEYANNSLNCNDGALCTTGDVCSGGVCAGSPVDCSGLNDSCNVGTCNPGTGACQPTPANEGATCSDGNLCTTGDVCSAGVCAGAPVDCSSLNNACNVGVCNLGTGLCQTQPANKGGPCNDGDLCTTGDICTAGVCAGTAVDCSGLDNACNVGICNGATGSCQAQPANNGGACDDGNLCTENDQCASGICGGTAVNCTALNNTCNVGVCNGATGLCEAMPTNQGGLCNDNNACTNGDVCVSGVCTGTPIAGCDPCVTAADCDDGNPCTDDACHPVGVCIHSNNSIACDDGLFCTLNDVCSAGSCVGTGNRCPGQLCNETINACVDCLGDGDCNDSNICTTDVCVGGLCQFNANSLACDDGLFCTVTDVCAGGSCVGSGDPCTPPDLCDENTDACVECLSPADCNDGNLCTTDTCTAGTCGNANNTLPCNDGLFCTANDVCTGGACAGSGDPCPSQLCSEKLDACVECLSAADCDDANVCTTDSCSVGSCSNADNAVPCDDGLFCTLTDICAGGACTGGGSPCTPPLLCNETTDACVECLVDLDCDDDNPCTDDVCTAGVCGNPNNILPCSDGLFCTASDVCAGGLCVGSGDPCLPPLLCNEITNNCVECLGDGDCNDGNACTTDTCNAGTCNFTNNTASCDDGLFCTATDVCSGGTCVGSGGPCTLPLVCNEATDACVTCLTGAECTDGNPCTDDVCTAGVCSNPDNTLPCDDGLFCTTTDICSGGTCMGSGDPCTPPDLCDESSDACVDCLMAADCDDSNLCTTDSCVAGLCQYVNNTLPCDDGLFCTLTDACSGGACVGSGIRCPGQFCNEGIDACVACLIDGNCNDGNPCTDDTCISGTCVATDNTALCDDGQFCTVTDVCSGGVCVGSGDPCLPPDLCDENLNACVECLIHADCDDSNPCTDDICTLGICGNANNTAPCDDGLFCTAADVCADGACVGSGDPCLPPDLCDEALNACVECLVAADCDDANVCTTDSCVSGLCQYTDNTLPCDDGLFCTATDVCAAGACVGSGDPCTLPQVCNETTDACVFCLVNADCDDGNLCTDDSCVSGACQYVNNTVSCNDGDICTITDRCGGGTCAGTPVDCTAFDTGCQVGVCNPGTGLCESANANEGGPCSDGDNCTGGDTCTAGNCAGTPVDCSALNSFCRQGTCSPATGLCVGTPINEGFACNDGNICTNADACAAGFCIGSLLPGCDPCVTAADCDDSNACTSDFCHPVGVCYHGNVAGSCDDANPCTDNDTCSTGVCGGTPIVGCNVCNVAADCDDGNPCTADDCVGNVCQYAPNDGLACDDNNICTSTDTCGGGQCAGTPIAGCDQCTVHAVCNDGNPCTTDSCHPIGICIYANNTLACNDGVPCTQNDVCSNGSCTGVPTPDGGLCDDGNLCTAGDQCFDGVCSGAPANHGASCSDGNLCTLTDVCVGGVCTGVPINCSPLTNACNMGTCNPTSGTCQQVPINEGGACDDGVACTASDTCSAGTCSGSAVDCSPLTGVCAVGTCNPTNGLCEAIPRNEGATCDDGSVCTVTDSCVNGSCTGAGTDCSPLDGVCVIGVCNPLSGICETAPANDGGACNDGLLCTLNDACAGGVCTGTVLDCTNLDSACSAGLCNPLSGACESMNVNEGGACDDGNLCTLNDVCAAGTCAGTPTVCSVLDSGCLVGMCNPTTGGCVQVPAGEGGACNDGNLCTQNDVCTGGTCAGTPVSCAGLTTACTLGVCNGSTGLCQAVPTNQGGPCNDTNRCTDNDRCNAGTCSGTARDCSSLTNACNVGTCNSVSGLCQATPANQGGSCNDGYVCTINDVCINGNCEGASTQPELVDLVWSPGSQTVTIGSTFDLTLIAQSATCFPQDLGSVQTILNWNPALVELLGKVDNGPYAWISSGFPNDSNLDGLNAPYTPVPGNDGNAVYLALASFVDGAPATPAGLIVTTFQFKALAATSGTPIVIPATVGTVTQSEVLAEGIFTDITGALDSTTITIVQCLNKGDCNDGNICTSDACVSGTCVHTNNTLPCNDGLFCTLTDVCGGGVCVGSGARCSGGLFCDEGSDACVQCLNNGHCNDGNICTTDTCTAGTCVITNNASPCDDGLFCTATDICSGGLCLGSGQPCPGQFCNETTNACVQCLNNSHCNDGNVCTNDSCASGVCANVNNTAACNDGLFCTVNDFCTAGACVGSVNPCAVNQQCSEATDQCVQCLNNGHCADGNPCTDDLCLTGTCFNPNNTASCNDGLFCNGNDQCAGGNCVAGTASPCTGQLCDEGGDDCVDCFSALDCDDGIPCTQEQCVAGACVLTPNHAVCNDSVFCNGVESCVVGTGCVSPGTSCDSLALCDEAADFCRCGTPTLAPAGSRHLRIVPSPGVTPVALMVDSSDPDLSCLPKYLAADGNLVNTPVFRTPAQWGTAFASGDEIEPSSVFSVRADCRVLPTDPENLSLSVSATTFDWGDVDGSGVIDVDDIVILLNAFSGGYIHEADQLPCAADNLLDIDDILAVLTAFAGDSYPCPSPCP